MKNKIWSIVILFFVVFTAGAQQKLTEEQIFTQLSKSIVWVEVSNIPGKGNNVCTGFAWQRPDQIVTSLHAMNPAGKIWIKYFNNARYLREAVVKKIYKDADLVLLEIKEGQLPVPPEVVPIKTNHTERIEAGDWVYALGYHSGAVRGQSRTLKKGYVVPPETLESFLPRPYTVILKSHKFPRVDIEIFYLEGSLLPGYSGAPCLDVYGRLVGIGDGGLEKGASNVSWIIPAKFLDDLMASAETEMPFGFASDLHFCTTIPNKHSSIDFNSLDMSDLELMESADGDTNIYDPIMSEDFEFYITKNRSLLEMYETSDNPENLIKFLEGMKEEFKVNMNYENLRFDIYEDIKNGVVLAIPEGDVLYFDDKDKHFQADNNQTKNVHLVFNGVTDDFSQTTIEDQLDATFEWLIDSMAVYWQVKSFSIDDDYTYILPYDKNRKIAYVLMKSEPFADAEFGGSSTIYLYVTLLMTEEKSFMSVASYKMANEKINTAQLNGLDCLNASSTDDCKYFESLIEVFCAAHLTTFAF